MQVHLVLTLTLNSILTRLGKAPSTFAFWVAFITALHDRKPFFEPPRQTESAEGDSHDPDGHTFGEVMGQCLNAAIRQWDSQTALPSYAFLVANGTDNSTISRILQLVSLCITTGDMAACRRLILVIVRSKTDPAIRFQSLYKPLIPQLRQLLEEHHIDLCSSPFGDFMRILIGLHLNAILGPKPRMSAVKIRKVGCGCYECNQLDAFLLSNTVKAQYPLRQDRRMHLERQALRAPDLVTFHTVRSGSPHTLVVTKKPEVAAVLQWQTRQMEARTFLSSIGDANVIATIMGPRYEDVQKALDGTQEFVMKSSASGGEQQEAAQTGIPEHAQRSEQSGTPNPGMQPPPLTDPATHKRKREGEKTAATATLMTGRDPTAVGEATRYVQNVLASDIDRSRTTIGSSHVSSIRASHTSNPCMLALLTLAAIAAPLSQVSTFTGGSQIQGVARTGYGSLAHNPLPHGSQPAVVDPQPRRSSSYSSKKAHTFLGPVIDLTDDD